MDLIGTWINEFGSVMKITEVAPDGSFIGTYASDTGATGEYTVRGVSDPNPDLEKGTQAVAFAISWHSTTGDPDPTWHWCSGFTGQVQTRDGETVMPTTFLLQKNTEAKNNWDSCVIATATYVKQPESC